MREGYHATGGEGCPYSELDEYLCEYVDNTMDPCVRKVFEEYLVVDPVLAEHVKQLRHTRELLFHYGCRHHAPSGLQVRLRQRLGLEMIRSQCPRFSMILDRFGAVLVFASAMAMITLSGMLISSFEEQENPSIADEQEVVSEVKISQPRMAGFQAGLPTHDADRPPVGGTHTPSLPYTTGWHDEVALSPLIWTPSAALSARRLAGTEQTSLQRIHLEY